MTEPEKALLAIDELGWLIKSWRAARWWRQPFIGHVILVKLWYRFPEIANTVRRAAHASTMRGDK